MKNQYVGDIGDYGKYALLRALSCRYSIGVNWYLTPDDDRSDGRFTDYLLKDNGSLDSELFSKLKALLFPDGKTLHQENRKFMPSQITSFCLRPYSSARKLTLQIYLTARHIGKIGSTALLMRLVSLILFFSTPTTDLRLNLFCLQENMGISL